MEKLKIDGVVVAEGKYDKIKLSSVIDAPIVTTDGFSIFNNAEKRAMLKALAERSRIIILTDSDGAGFVIRNKLKSIIGNSGSIINIYIPRVKGKEQRKNKPSKEGFLGVEGTDISTLKEIFTAAGVLCGQSNEKSNTKVYSKSELYSLGLSGRRDSAEKRSKILREHSLPENMSANAFLEALNLLGIELN